VHLTAGSLPGLVQFPKEDKACRDWNTQSLDDNGILCIALMKAINAGTNLLPASYGNTSKQCWFHSMCPPSVRDPLHRSRPQREISWQMPTQT
jgi:hypothetical protein